MPSIALSGSRPKLAGAIALPVEILGKDPAPNNSDKTIEYRICVSGLNPPAFTVEDCSTTNDSPTVTTSNSFAWARVGDTVSGTGIPAETTIAAIVSDTEITLSEDATATGTVTLTIDPPAYDATIMGLKIGLSASGANLSAEVGLYAYSGANSHGPNDDELPTDDESAAQIGVVGGTVNLDSFLTLARVPRTNS